MDEINPQIQEINDMPNASIDQHVCLFKQATGINIELSLMLHQKEALEIDLRLGEEGLTEGLKPNRQSIQ